MPVSELIERLSAVLASRADSVACAYLYGSVARGQERADSDIDIAVLYKHAPPETLDGLGFDIAGELERATGRRVDVAVLNRAPADLVHRVLRDGTLLFEADRRQRVAFEVDRRAEYFDLLPYLREYRRSALGAVR